MADLLIVHCEFQTPVGALFKVFRGCPQIVCHLLYDWSPGQLNHHCQCAGRFIKVQLGTGLCVAAFTHHSAPKSF